MMMVASPAIALTKHSMAVDLPSPGGHDSKRPRLMLSPLGLQHLPIADGGGDEIELGAGRFVRNDVVPGAFGNPRTHGPQIAIDQHDPVLEWVGFVQQTVHQSNDGGFVALAIDE